MIVCAPPAVVERIDTPHFLTNYRVVLATGTFIDLVGDGLTLTISRTRPGDTLQVCGAMLDSSSRTFGNEYLGAIQNVTSHEVATGRFSIITGVPGRNDPAR